MKGKISSVCLRGVTKVFGSVRAVADLSFEVSSGEVVAVMGPNGAGKSTLLSILSLNAWPTRGEVLFNGCAAKTTDPLQRGAIGLLSHLPLVYPDLTARENLILFAGLYGLEDPAKSAAFMEEKLGLHGFAADRTTRVLSRGQLQRVALARAIISEPDLLLLDEPAAGLDSAAVSQICKLLSELSEKKGIAVMVTHEPEVAARTATRAILLRRGKIVADVPSPGSAEKWLRLYTDTVEGDLR